MAASRAERDLPVQLLAATLPSPLGELLVVVDELGGLCRLAFLGAGGEPALRRALAEPLPGLERDRIRLEPDAFVDGPGAPARTQLAEWFAGRRREFELDLAVEGTPFQQRVWRALGRVPWGTTITYGELARRLGAAGAARAVGQASHVNPVPVVIPCHRVVGEDGALVGFGAGLSVKRALLDLERGQAVLWG